LLIISAGRGGGGGGVGAWAWARAVAGAGVGSWWFSNRLASLLPWLCSRKRPHEHAETSSLEYCPKCQPNIGVKERDRWAECAIRMNGSEKPERATNYNPEWKRRVRRPKGNWIDV